MLFNHSKVGPCDLVDKLITKLLRFSSFWCLNLFLGEFDIKPMTPYRQARDLAGFKDDCLH